MNLSIDLSSFAQTQYKISAAAKDIPKKKQEKVSPEQEEINRFKEENSNVNKRMEALYAKFKGGQELTKEELDYIAKNNPDLYKEIVDLMRERQAMEMQMKLAKTKQDDTVSSVKQPEGAAQDVTGQKADAKIKRRGKI